MGTAPATDTETRKTASRRVAGNRLHRRAIALMCSDAEKHIEEARERFDFVTTGRDAIEIDIFVPGHSDGLFGDIEAVFQRVVLAPRGGLGAMVIAVDSLCDQLDPPRTLSECAPLGLETATLRGQCGAMQSDRECGARHTVRSNGRANKASAE